jgi:hypothetical protein
MTQPDNGGAVVEADGAVTFSPTYDFVGSTSFTYRVKDLFGATSATATVTVNVTGAPIARPDLLVLQEGKSATLDLLANDEVPFGQTLYPDSAVVVTSPGFGTVTMSKGSALYSPNKSFAGTDSFRYRVSDTKGNQSGVLGEGGLVTVVVNARPVAVADQAITAVDLPVEIDVTANDTDTDDVIDVDSVVIAGDPSDGSVEVLADGLIEYTPNKGFSGTDSFSYVVSDSRGGVSLAGTVDVVVDQPPILDDVPVSGEPGKPVVIDLSGYAIDPDGTIDWTTLEFFGVPAGTAVASGTTLTYTPDKNATGTVSFSWVVSDDLGFAGEPALILVSMNDRPQAVDDSAVVEPFGTVFLDLLANDVDGGVVGSPTLDPSSVEIDEVGTIPGTWSYDLGTGQLQFTAGATWAPEARFSYTVADAQGLRSDPADVVILLEAAPIALDDDFLLAEDTSTLLDLLDNDSDPDGTLDPSTLEIVDAPAFGTLTLQADGQVLYVPDQNYFGPDAFTYRVSDDDGYESNLASVLLTVESANDAPVVEATEGQVVAEGATITLSPARLRTEDADNAPDQLDYTIVAAPTRGVLLISGVPAEAGDQFSQADIDAGRVEYAHQAANGTDDSFSFEVTDGEVVLGDDDPFVFVFDVGGVDDAPVTTTNDGLTVLEGGTAVLSADNLETTDEDSTAAGLLYTLVAVPDHGTLRIDGVVLPVGGKFSQRALDSGRVSYRHDGSEGPSDSFVFRVTDGNTTLADATFEITVQNVPEAPVAVDDDVQGVEDQVLDIDVLGNDSDPEGDLGDVASAVVLVDAPEHGAATVLADGTVRYAPAADFFGVDRFTYRAKDASGLSSGLAEVTVVVAPAPDAPVAVADSYSLNEDQSQDLALLANDTDADGNLIPNAAAIVLGGQPDLGSVVVLADGRVRFTPTANVSGTTTFSYQAQDASGLSSDPVTVTVELAPIADAPVAVDDAVGTFEDTLVDIPVLANDSDADAPIAAAAGSVKITTAPIHGTAVILANGQIRYTPAANYSGTDSLQYVVVDSVTGDSVPATVTITIDESADAPSAVADSATVAEDGQVTIDVLANDQDADGDLPDDDASVVLVDFPLQGTATVQADGTVRYAPRADVNGTDSFTYQARDAAGNRSAPVTVSVTITAVGDAPVAVADVATALEDGIVLLDVLANDSDADGDLASGSASVQIVTAPDHGTAVVTADGRIQLTPTAGYNGPVVLSYRAIDAAGLSSAPVTVTVTVSGLPDAPVGVDDSASVDEDDDVIIDVLGNDSDIDGDLIADSDAVMVVDLPLHGDLEVLPDGDVLYTPDADYNGPDGFTYRAVDSQGQTSGLVQVDVDVNAVADAPVALGDWGTVPEDTVTNVAVLDNDTDADGDLVASATAVVVVTAPAHGTSVVNADGTVKYTPALDYTGADSFSYRAVDKSGLQSAPVTVTLDVGGSNDAPVALPDAVSTTEGQAVVLAVLSNDTDADSNLVAGFGAVQIVSAPAHATAAVADDGTVVITPEAGWSGVTTWTYQAKDQAGALSNVVTVTVTVQSVNDNPVAASDNFSAVEDTAATLDVVANDSDPDGDSLTLMAVGGAAHGTVTIVGNRAVYTPAADYSGSDTFSYTVSDGQGGMSSTSVTVTVAAVNDKPVAVSDSAATTEDSPVSVAVLGNDSDVDGDTLTVVANTQPTKGSVTVTGGVFTYTPAPNAVGTDTFSYTVSDGKGGTASASVTVTIGAINDLPVANADAVSTPEDTVVSVSPLTNDADPDGDSLSIASFGAPTHGGVSLSGSTFSYKPGTDYVGEDTFTYTVADGKGGVATATVTITVSPVNDNPVANADSVVTTEDTAVAIGVLSNDADVDGDTLTLASASGAQHGTVAIAGGVVTYTPAPNFSGSDTFSYTISDGKGGTSTANVSVTVDAVNDAPSALADARTTNEDTPATIAVLSNDSDPDGDTLTVASNTQPTKGSVTLSGGVFTYTPAVNFNGTDSFTYTVSDGKGGSSTATVSLVVNAVNDPPSAVADSRLTSEDSAVDILVLANDVDPEGDSLTVTSVTAAAHGTAVLVGNTVRYTPKPDYTGPDHFSYSISDGQGGSATAPVTVTVTPANDAPVAVDDVRSTNEDTAVSIAVLSNDSDLDGDSLVVIANTTPAHGVVTFAGGVATYQPALNYSGPDTFDYTLSDGNGGTAVASVSLTVLAVNDAPVAKADAGSTNEDQAVTVDVLANDSDLEGDTLTVSTFTNPTKGALSWSGGKVTYTPNANTSGTDTFSYTVSDGKGGSSTATVTVTVAALNDPPAAIADAVTTAEDTTADFAVLANDTDPEGDPLTLLAVTQPATGGTTSVSGNLVHFVPTPDFAGTSTFSYTVADGKGGSATATVTVTVSAVNDAPVAFDDAVGTAEDVAVQIAVLLNDVDADGNTLSVTGQTSPSNGAVTLAAGIFKYTPNKNYVGDDSFSYTVSDGKGGTDTATVSITVGATNDSPVAVADARTTSEDTAVTLDVIVNDSDADGDTLSVLSYSNPAKGSLSWSGTNVTYTPNPNQNGADSFTYTVTDGKGGTSTATVSLTVSPVNDAPVAVADGITTAEDTASALVDLTLNDHDVEAQALSLVSVGAAAHGTVAISGNQVKYTPAANYFGPDAFTYVVKDATGATATATVTVTVTAVNDGPVAVADSLATSEDTASVAFDPTLNDTDADGDALTLLSVSQGAHGSVVISGNSLVFTPAANYSGPDTVSYTVVDGKGGSATGVVAVTVGATNDAPVATPDSKATTEDTPTTIAVLSNDTDPDGDTLTLLSVAQPPAGTGTTALAGNSVTYTPPANWFGATTFAYTVSDGKGGTATANVTVTVSSVNDLPDAVNDTASTSEDVPLTIAVRDNDSDPDGDPLTVVAVTQPSAGTGSATFTASGVTYTPPANFSGTATFSYTVSDGRGGTDVATVTVLVSPLNDPPPRSPTPSRPPKTPPRPPSTSSPTTPTRTATPSPSSPSAPPPTAPSPSPATRSSTPPTPTTPAPTPSATPSATARAAPPP